MGGRDRWEVGVDGRVDNTLFAVEDNSSVSALSEDEDSSASELFEQIETTSGERFTNYLQLAEDDDFLPKVSTLYQARETLQEAEQVLDVDAALLYVRFSTSSDVARPDDPLEILLVTPYGEPLVYRHPNVVRAQVEAAATELRYESTRQFSRGYFAPAQQLYDWFIAPMASTIERENIDNISFILADGLRTLPIAVLHDGNQYMIEKYSLSLLPTFSLTDFSLSDRSVHSEDMTVLAMGASTFESQAPLPAAAAELAFISENTRVKDVFLNEDFTVDNFNNQLNSQQYDVVHLATHATFEAGD